MSNFINRLYHPEIYQGSHRTKDYFEGWYFKIVDDQEKMAIAIIPGVSIGREQADHAFIQVLDGMNAKSYYYSFPFENFWADDRILDVRIDKNRFTKKVIMLDLPNLTGKLSIQNIHPIPTSLFSPGIMGWYSFIPFMQCYHGIVSMHHQLSGSLVFKDQHYNLKKGIGYLEKDWGTSFPKCWIWTQCNHFSKSEKISIMASVAHIPFMGNYFIGFIVSLLIGENVHIFATYNGSKMKVMVANDHVELSFRKGKKYLRIKGVPGPGAELRSPVSGLMMGKVNESLQGKLYLTYQDEGSKPIEANGRNAGIEIAGDTSILETMVWKR